MVQEEKSGVDLAEIFTRAADLLEPEGAWTQGAFSRNADGSVDHGGDEDPDGVADNPVCWCLLGAMAKVSGYDLVRGPYPFSGPLKQATRTLRAFTGNDPSEWNDAPGRRQEDVVAILRKAAKATPTSPTVSES